MCLTSPRQHTVHVVNLLFPSPTSRTTTKRRKRRRRKRRRGFKGGSNSNEHNNKQKKEMAREGKKENIRDKQVRVSFHRRGGLPPLSLGPLSDVSRRQRRFPRKKTNSSLQLLLCRLRQMKRCRNLCNLRNRLKQQCSLCRKFLMSKISSLSLDQNY